MYIDNITIERLMPHRNYMPMMHTDLRYEPNAPSNISAITFESSYKINIEALLENEDMNYTQDLIGKHIELKNFATPNIVPALMPIKKVIKAILTPDKKQNSMGYIRLEE